MKIIKDNKADIFVYGATIFAMVILCGSIYFLITVINSVDNIQPDGNSFYETGYLIDVEYVGGAFGYKARTVFFFDDNRVVNVIDYDQVSVELNNNVRLELQNSNDGGLVYLIGVETIQS